MSLHESLNSLAVPHLGGVQLPLETVAKSVENAVDSLCDANVCALGAPRPAKLWRPKRAVFLPAALELAHGQRIKSRLESLGIETQILKSNRLTGLNQESAAKTYATAKQTLAIVAAPASQFRLSPIPPSADWQFHLAQGCPAHCQYCYLAGSLSGPPIVRAYANLDEILGNLAAYESREITTFEASCYTDPLGIEHLTGSLARAIAYFGTRENAFLRVVSKFDAVDDLLDLPHNGHTRFRASVNAAPISDTLEGGTANVAARLLGLRKMAQRGYPVGLVVAPIMPLDDWPTHYETLLAAAQNALDFPCDLTFELITHRFTPGSKDVLLQWYPATKLDLDESKREVKRNKFGGTKFVYPRETMRELKTWFQTQIEQRFPDAKILYWT